MLLYRLLVEIYRSDGTGNGLMENDRGQLQPRSRNDNECRQLKIIKDTENNPSFRLAEKSIHFGSINGSNLDINQFVYVPEITQEEANKDGNKTVHYVSTAGVDTMLFHEMLHWFHLLRDGDRVRRENPELRLYNIKGAEIIGSLEDMDLQLLTALRSLKGLDQESESRVTNEVGLLIGCLTKCSGGSQIIIQDADIDKNLTIFFRDGLNVQKADDVFMYQLNNTLSRIKPQLDDDNNKKRLFWGQYLKAWKNSKYFWFWFTPNGTVSFEEIRTILGSAGADEARQTFLNGDELSENIYRHFTKQSLRYGYGSLSWQTHDNFEVAENLFNGWFNYFKATAQHFGVQLTVRILTFG